MRNPLNRNKFRSNDHTRPEQPMLLRRRRFRYDDASLSDRSWSDARDEFDPELQEFDMDVTGAGAIGGAAPIRPAQLAPAQGLEASAPGGLEAPQDEVRISSAARALGQLDPGTQIHEARLAEIRAAIADGSYETPEKLEAAVERLVSALNSGRR